MCRETRALVGARSVKYAAHLPLQKSGKVLEGEIGVLIVFVEDIKLDVVPVESGGNSVAAVHPVEMRRAFKSILKKPGVCEVVQRADRQRVTVVGGVRQMNVNGRE